MHLDIDFWWILVDFWSQVGWKIHQKSIQKGIEKTIEKSRRLGSVLEACWGVLRRPGSSKPQTGTRSPSPPTPTCPPRTLQLQKTSCREPQKSLLTLQKVNLQEGNHSTHLDTLGRLRARCGFWEASWGRKSTKNRFQKA